MHGDVKSYICMSTNQEQNDGAIPKLIVNKNTWKENEDNQLMFILATHYDNRNINWYNCIASSLIITIKSNSWIRAHVANEMTTKRSAKQCRQRYLDNLLPGLNKSPWAAEEDEILRRANQTLSNKWTEIAKSLPGRSTNSIKNRWHIINRKTKKFRNYYGRPVESTLSPTLLESHCLPTTSGNRKFIIWHPCSLMLKGTAKDNMIFSITTNTVSYCDGLDHPVTIGNVSSITLCFK